MVNQAFVEGLDATFDSIATAMWEFTDKVGSRDCYVEIDGETYIPPDFDEYPYVKIALLKMYKDNAEGEG